jgi:hypothetical protein
MDVQKRESMVIHWKDGFVNNTVGLWGSAL